MSSRTRRSREGGQVLVIVAGGLIALLLGAGLVVDVGFALAEQRNTQNAADSASKAGAVVLARRAAEQTVVPLPPPPPAGWDEEVRNRVTAAAAVNGAALLQAEYTTYDGTPLGQFVGAGTVPPTAAGVRAATQKTPSTFLIRIVGQNNWDIREEATAVSGPTTACSDSSLCINLPVTFPVQVFQCLNNGKSDLIQPPQDWAFGQAITLPLCGGNPGSVGWIDWDPPAGGTSELIDAVQHPPNFPIPVPSWQYITSTGGVSAQGLETALNAYAGQIVQVPIFDSTCPTQPTNQLTSGCATPGGNGQNQWYHIIKFLSFRLDSPQGAWLQGGNGNEAICGTNATQCLKGTFVTWSTQGAVGAPCTADCDKLTYSVQLIK